MPGQSQLESSVLSPGPEMLLRTMSRSVALLHPESVLMYVAPDIIEGHADSRALGHHLRPYWYPRAILRVGTIPVSVACTAT